MKLPLLFLFIFLGCNSANTEMSRVSIEANAIAVQLGSQTVNQTMIDLGLDFDSSYREECIAFKTDRHGNMYCTGFTNGNLGDENEGGTGSGADAFVAKFYPDGKIAWIAQLGSSNFPLTGNPAGEQQCHAIDIDSQGNVYCAGNTSSDIEGSGYAGGGKDAFIVKFNSSGERQWVKQFGTTEHDTLSAILVMSDGTIFCGGQTYGNFGSERSGGRPDLDPVAAGFQADADVFVSKLTPSGMLTTFQLGETSLSIGAVQLNENIESLVLDESGKNIIALINTNGSLAATNPTPGNSDIVLWKLNPSLGTIWRRQYPYPAKNRAGSALVSEIGEIFVGYTTHTPIGEPQAGSSDAGVLKLDRNGNILKKVQLGTKTKVPGGDKSKQDSCDFISRDREGSIYCLGSTTGAIGERNADPTGATSDLVIMKWDRNLNFVTAIQFGAETPAPGGDFGMEEYAGGLHIDYFGNLSFGATTNGSIGEPAANSLRDVFIFKMDMSDLKLQQPRF